MVFSRTRNEPDGERHPINQLHCILTCTCTCTCLLSQPHRNRISATPQSISSARDYCPEFVLALLWCSYGQLRILECVLLAPDSSSDTSLTCLPAWRCAALTDWDPLTLLC